MSTRANVKPLTHWAIYKGYRMRFTQRETDAVAGMLTTPDGTIPFRYDAEARVVYLQDRTVAINEYGWELDTLAPPPVS